MEIYRASFGPGPVSGKLVRAGQPQECREIRHADGWTEVIQGKRVFQSLAPGSEIWERKAGDLAGRSLVANPTDENLNLSKPIVIEKGDFWKVVSTEGRL